MVAVVALKALKYPVPRRAGERFDASPRQANILTRAGKVRADVPESPPRAAAVAPHATSSGAAPSSDLLCEQPERRGRHRRRDMRAED